MNFEEVSSHMSLLGSISEIGKSDFRNYVLRSSQHRNGSQEATGMILLGFGDSWVESLSYKGRTGSYGRMFSSSNSHREMRSGRTFAIQEPPLFNSLLFNNLVDNDIENVCF